MKKLAILFLTMLPFIGFSQKKANGTIYIEHPAIEVAEAYTKAFAAGDTTKIAGYLADNFKAHFVATATPFDKGINKLAYLQGIKAWHNSLDYFTITPIKGGYPDALEYTDPKFKEVYVETWDHLKGVHKETGVKVNMNFHQEFKFNANNKIEEVWIYNNPNIGNEIRAGYGERKNGIIYNQHECINKVRRMLFSLENNDLDRYYSYFDETTTFSDINNMKDKLVSLEIQKIADKQMLDTYDIVSLEQVGYPDYMEYEMGNTGVVFSWWIIYLERKSDKKKIECPIHYQHTFNKEEKIVDETAYYNGSLFN
ncbi:MAG: hypothetical protein ACI9XO_004492 [Paraglaciecola sp.]|jgi:hypothetical protein